MGTLTHARSNANDVDGGNGDNQRRQPNLHKGEVLLPPDVLGVHADKVVRVHDGVDEAVEHDSQVDVTVVAGVHVHPVELRQAQGRQQMRK